jgi:hypothetical protein
LIAGLLVTFLMREPPKSERKASVLSRTGQTLALVWQRPALRWNFLCLFLSVGSRAVVEIYLPVRIAEVTDDPAPKIGLVLGPSAAEFSPPPPADDLVDPRHLSDVLDKGVPKKRSGALIGGMVVAAAVLAAGWWLFLRDNATPEPTAAAEPAPDAAPVEPPKKTDPAHVILRGQSDVKVFVDGRRRGETPTVLEDLKPGRRYVILLVAEGFADGKIEVPSLQPGEEREIDVKLEKL